MMGVKFTFGGLLVGFMLLTSNDVIAFKMDYEVEKDLKVQIIIAHSDTSDNSGSAPAIIEDEEDEEPDCD